MNEIEEKNFVSLIVAYRDPGDGSRKAQLDIFLKQMQVLLNGRTNYHIYIIFSSYNYLLIYIHYSNNIL